MTTSNIKRIILGLAFLISLSGYLWTSSTRADEAAKNADHGDRSTATASATNNILFAAQRRRRVQAASFDHNSKGHARLGNCQSCHNINVSDSDRDPNVKYYPGHRACIDCHDGKRLAHNFADETIKRFDAFCGICHSGMPISLSDKGLFDFKAQTRVTRGVSAGGSDFMTSFSHKAHYEDTPVRKTIKLEAFEPASQYKVDLNVDPRCNECHVRTAELKNLPAHMQQGQEMLVEKGHSTCFQCHNTRDGMERKTTSGKPYPYMNDCAECHDRISGRERRERSEFYNRVSEFRHSDHEFDTRSILQQNRGEYKRREQQRDFLCVDCHDEVKQSTGLADIRYPREAKCDDCHNPNRQPGLPDPLTSTVKTKLKNAQR